MGTSATSCRTVSDQQGDNLWGQACLVSTDLQALWGQGIDLNPCHFAADILACKYRSAALTFAKLDHQTGAESSVRIPNDQV